MTLKAPHYKGQWDWTTTTTGSTGGKITAVEFDVSNEKQAADRLGKLLGTFASTDAVISEAKEKLASVDDKKSYIRRLLRGKDLDISFADEDSDSGKSSSKKASAMDRMDDLEAGARPTGDHSDSGTSAVAGRDAGTMKSAATSPNAADEDPAAIMEGDATASGHIAAADEPEEQERETDLSGDTPQATTRRKIGGRGKKGSRKGSR